MKRISDFSGLRRKAFVAIVLCIALILGVKIPMAVAAESGDFDVYTEAGVVTGIALNDIAGGALRLNVRADATGISNGYGAVSFDLGSINRDDSTGLLLKFATNKAGNGSGPYIRMAVEDSNGVMYYFSDASTDSNIVYVHKINGKLYKANIKVSKGAFSLPLANEGEGTLYIPWDKMFAAKSGWPAMASGVTITRLYIAFPMQSVLNTMWNRPLALVTAATANILSADNVAVKRVLRTKDLSYSKTEGDTSVDVNTADKLSGKKVSANTIIAGNFVVTTTGNEIATVAANYEFTRVDGVSTYPSVYQGEYDSGEGLSGEAVIIFAQAFGEFSEYGIIVTSSDGSIVREFRGERISGDNRFGIALFGCPAGSYTAQAYVDGVLGDKVGFTVA